jgi:hypothetical protein
VRAGRRESQRRAEGGEAGQDRTSHGSSCRVVVGTRIVARGPNATNQAYFMCIFRGAIKVQANSI